MTSTDEKRDQVEPLQQYVRRHENRQCASQRYHRLLRRLVLAKRIYLGAFIGYTVFDPTVSAVLLPVAISLVPVVIIQYWLVRRWLQHHRAAVFYQRAIDRVEDGWIGSGDPGDRYADVNHLYSSDLDIFGGGSLFQLLCTPGTACGRDTLAHWLQRPADAGTIRARQAAVREMAGRMDWREALDATGAATPRVGMADVRVAAKARPVFAPPWLRILAALFGWCWLTSFWMGWRYGGWWWNPFLSGLAVEIPAYLLVRPRVRALCQRGYQVGLSLVAVSAFARLLTRVTWRSELLRRTRASLRESPGPIPPTIAATLGLLVQLPVVYFITVQLLPVLETRLLARVARLRAAWESIGQCEALAAFAALAFEHPGDCFPELVTSGACFVATEMGHPLIAESRSVRNDVKLDEQLQLLMVSGSNMSGKSTLLRTVGVNAVLAFSGAPVRARTLRLSPLAVGTAMRFRDSLEQGTSYFYSVLCRLRAVLDLLDKPLPLLFLLDEILPGTNSHDRRVGAEAVIRRLLAGKAIGLVTTHDLELTRVVEHLAPATANICFAEEVVAGELRFDYRIRPGVVQSSNALTLMRSMGLDV